MYHFTPSVQVFSIIGQALPCYPGFMTQNKLLLGLGVPWRSQYWHAFALPREALTLPFQAPIHPGQDRLHDWNTLNPRTESTTVRHWSHLRFGVWLTPGWRRAAGWINVVHGTSPVQLSQYNRGNCSDGRTKRDQRRNPSLHLICILYASHGSRFGGGIMRKPITPHPQP